MCEKFKISSLQLKETFLAKQKEEKEKRKRLRLLNRGFRPPPPVEEGAEDQPPPVDEEIENDPEDFDKESHERELVRLALQAEGGLVVDGTWNGFPEESVLAVDGAGYANLLTEARRVPELVVILNCKEEASFKRLIDEEQMKAEYDALMEKRAQGMKERREKDRAEK